MHDMLPGPGTALQLAQRVVCSHEQERTASNKIVYLTSTDYLHTTQCACVRNWYIWDAVPVI
jgi:hypothetical protein